MSLRTKIVAALVLLSFVATGAIGALSYRATSRGLSSQVDQSVTATSVDLARRVAARRGPGGDRDDRDRGPGPVPPIFSRPGDERFGLLRTQFVSARGRVVGAPDAARLPVDDEDLEVAAQLLPGRTQLRDVEVDDDDYRMATTSVGRGRGAVQVARSLDENQELLDRLRNRILLSVLVVVLAAAAAGWIIATSLTDRLRRLTGVAEEVAGTGRLDVEVPAVGEDGAGRLAGALNEMLASLRQAEDDQQRLVQDAGHELKTPLTSLRTNVDVLSRYPDLPADQRTRLLQDLEGETRELTDLVNELVALANGRRLDEAPQRVRLGDVAAPVVERARRRTGREITLVADGTERTVRVAAIERAVSNLVDNATKFDASDGPVEVEVVGGRLTVRDRGPGIDPSEGTRLFDRFYRSDAARSQPGSGLGLAIVADVVRRHGGTVFAQPREGGGAEVGFVLPPS
ncbi:MAG: ATP-binding protein [Actinomycetes bacterium]